MWNYEKKACDDSDHEYQELWLWMTRLTPNAKLRKELLWKPNQKTNSKW